MDAFKTLGYSVSKGRYSTDEWRVGKDPETGVNNELKKTTEIRAESMTTYSWNPRAYSRTL